MLACHGRSLYKAFGLLQEFLPEIVELQVDPSDAVRVELAALLGEAAAVAPRASVLQPIAITLAALAADTTQSVAKAAISTATAVFRTSFAVVALQVGVLALHLGCNIGSACGKFPVDYLVTKQADCLSLTG